MPDNPNTEAINDPRQKGKNEDKDGNEIGRAGKRTAGALLIFFTVLVSVGIVAYWPDKLPDPKINVAPIYQHKLFRICLVGLPDNLCCPDSVYVPTFLPTITAADTSAAPGTDTSNRNLPANITASPQYPMPVKYQMKKKCLIHLNTLLLILVAMGGFLGNIIHVATSFTTYVGAGKFKRSWVLWYYVKPFTAAALAIGLYFIFRAGFLNMSDGGASINLYGLMTLAILTGLFTDKATEKLKEIFEVIFRSKDVRPDPLVDPFKITGITPLQIEKGKENRITITGENLDKQKFVITINNQAIANPVVSSSAIAFSYVIPDSQKDMISFHVSVKDEKGKEYYKADLGLRDETAGGNSPGAAGEVTDDHEPVG